MAARAGGGRGGGGFGGGGGGIGGGGGGTGGGGRPASGPWNRLKPVNIDPLESIGLPSKGDNRLLDFKTQERYHTKIIDRYMAFCSQAGQADELLRRFDSLNLDVSKHGSGDGAGLNSSGAETLKNETPSSTPSIVTAATFSILKPSPEGPAASGRTSRTGNPAQQELSVLLMSLRKLREGLVATQRHDAFAVQAYLFSIRLSLLAQHLESYHPALQHALQVLHGAYRALAALELAEVAAYAVLDLACRQQDLAAAYAARARYALRDSKVDAALAALAHDNWALFWKVRRGVDRHRARLMGFAEPRVRLLALKAIGRAYLSVDRAFVEAAAAGEWETLTRENQVGWTLEGERVIIRKPKGR